MRHSIACPRCERLACVKGSGSPDATRNCACTRSTPVTHLGHGMLDLQARVHLEKIEVGGVAAAFEQEFAGARRCGNRPPWPRQWRRRPCARESRRLSAGHGLSSITFWWRRCAEHSRSKMCTVLPCTSAKTWISTWRGCSISRSTYSESLPNDALASRRAAASASPRSAASAHRLHADAAATGCRLDQDREADARGRGLSASSD